MLEKCYRARRRFRARITRDGDTHQIESPHGTPPGELPVSGASHARSRLEFRCDAEADKRYLRVCRHESAIRDFRLHSGESAVASNASLLRRATPRSSATHTDEPSAHASNHTGSGRDSHSALTRSGVVLGFAWTAASRRTAPARVATAPHCDCSPSASVSACNAPSTRRCPSARSLTCCAPFSAAIAPPPRPPSERSVTGGQLRGPRGAISAVEDRRPGHRGIRDRGDSVWRLRGGRWRRRTA